MKKVALKNMVDISSYKKKLKTDRKTQVISGIVLLAILICLFLVVVFVINSTKTDPEYVRENHPIVRINDVTIMSDEIDKAYIGFYTANAYSKDSKIVVDDFYKIREEDLKDAVIDMDSLDYDSYAKGLKEDEAWKEIRRNIVNLEFCKQIGKHYNINVTDRERDEHYESFLSDANLDNKLPSAKNYSVVDNDEETVSNNEEIESAQTYDGHLNEYHKAFNNYIDKLVTLDLYYEKMYYDVWDNVQPKKSTEQRLNKFLPLINGTTGYQRIMLSPKSDAVLNTANKLLNEFRSLPDDDQKQDFIQYTIDDDVTPKENSIRMFESYEDGLNRPNNNSILPYAQCATVDYSPVYTFFSKDQLANNVAESLNVGDISDIIVTEDSYEIIYCVDKINWDLTNVSELSQIPLSQKSKLNNAIVRNIEKPKVDGYIFRVAEDLKFDIEYY